MSLKISFIGITCFDIIKVNNIVTDIKPGGGAFFSYQVSKKYIENVDLISCIGSDFSRDYFVDNIIPDGVLVFDDTKTDTAILDYKDGSDLSSREVIISFKISDDINPALIKTKHLNSSIIHVSTMPPKQQVEIVRYLKNNSDAKISLDTDISFLKKPNLEKFIESLKLVDIIFLNRYEFEVLKNDIPKNTLIILKKDSDGSDVLLDSKIIASSKAEKLLKHNPTGAGDYLAGIFLCQLINKHSIKKSLKIAVSHTTELIKQ